jgi:citrate synthase
MAPSLEKGYCWNLFTMIGLVNASTGTADPLDLSCMRCWGNVIMDHGLANSTLALGVAASTLVDSISAIISGSRSRELNRVVGPQEAGFKTLVMQVPILIMYLH